ncbi:ATP-grasp domain-containing protein [Psychrobacillus sp. PGGUH221]|uniref:ATP-grasp domain-containing protein n=1 Tax=Psychrobacillus sp. PGGUH221 TaxID=3020058 RepID=UPI0035C776CC
MSNEWILTIGSTRQSGEFQEATKNDYPWRIKHVVEELKPWTSKSLDEIMTECIDIIENMEFGPIAMINFGRASVPYGIDTIALCFEKLKEKYAEKLKETKIIGPTAEMAQIFSDKWLIFKSLSNLNLPLPRTLKVDKKSLNKVKEEILEGKISLPAIIKVTDLTGGSGMEYLDSINEIDKTVDILSQLDRDLIITEFVNGDEISFDVLRLGNECLVFPPGVKTKTDTNLTHADHKIKVNGLVKQMDSLEKQVKQISEYYDLQGFFSIEGVVTNNNPIEWKILEGATRVTNNYQMQNHSIGFDSFLAISRYLRGLSWMPDENNFMRLSLSIPIYVHRQNESLKLLQDQSWVLQVKIENLSEMPLSRDSRSRLTIKMEADRDLDERLSYIEKATGDSELIKRVNNELRRQLEYYICESQNYENKVWN